eukprot:scaffold11622_cov63-Phaeocystis_antarctica.AAC.8
MYGYLGLGGYSLASPRLQVWATEARGARHSVHIVVAMSAALSQKKQAEGEACMQAAAKALKTSAMSFKFRPDWETACAEYEKAITCFKVRAAPWPRAYRSFILTHHRPHRWPRTCSGRSMPRSRPPRRTRTSTRRCT